MMKIFETHGALDLHFRTMPLGTLLNVKIVTSTIIFTLTFSYTLGKPFLY